MSTAKKVAKGKSKPKIKSKPKSAPATTAEPGYAGHTAGSRKGTIHELFDKEGEDVAWTRGLKVGLKQGTLRSRFAAWKRLPEQWQRKDQDQFKYVTCHQTRWPCRTQ
jgi:hypothetical protein